MSKDMEKSEQRKRIGGEIAELRIKQGLTQEQLAEKLGIKQQSVSRIELGLFSVGFDMLQKIAEVLNSDIKIIKKDEEK
jgi:transcriptional regulator with XRE-family HTH domain